MFELIYRRLIGDTHRKLRPRCGAFFGLTVMRVSYLFKTFEAANCPIVRVLRSYFYRLNSFLSAFLRLEGKSRTPKVQLFLYLANYDCTFFNFHTCYDPCCGWLRGVFRPKNTKIFKHSEHLGAIFYVFARFYVGFFISHPLFRGFLKPEIRKNGFFPHDFWGPRKKVKKTFFCNLLFHAPGSLKPIEARSHCVFKPPRSCPPPRRLWSASPIIHYECARRREAGHGPNQGEDGTNP